MDDTHFLRLPEVIRRTGLARSSIYSAVGNGTFPRPVRLSARAVAWPSDEVDAWLEARRAERDAAGEPPEKSA